jgi:DNA-binding phage protein
MNKADVIKNTASYRDAFITSLKDPNEAYGYLQIAIEEYQIDNDSEALLIALRNITDAQGGMTELARKTHLNRQNLHNILSRKGNP